jgi:hypothetical protein
MSARRPQEALAELDQEYRAANYDRGAAWESLRHQAYDPSLEDLFKAKADRCARLIEQIIRYKKLHQV